MQRRPLEDKISHFCKTVLGSTVVYTDSVTASRAVLNVVVAVILLEFENINNQPTSYRNCRKLALTGIS